MILEEFVFGFGIAVAIWEVVMIVQLNRTMKAKRVPAKKLTPLERRVERAKQSGHNRIVVWNTNSVVGN